MKHIFILFAILIGLNANSQNTCGTASPFCTGGSGGVTFPAGVNTGNAQSGPNYGCLFSQPNPAWYYVQVSTSGNLIIALAGTAGGDVDFICWGPFSSLAGVCSSLTAGNTVDCSYSGSATETCTIPSGIAGQYYMVLITNYLNTVQNITFNQVGGTGTTNCSLVSSNSSICAGNSATIVASNSSNLTGPSYSLNPGGITSPTPTFIVSPLITTIYTVYVTGINSSNAVQTLTTTSTVTVKPQPIVSPTFTQATCTNSNNAVNLNLTFNPASATPTYTVAWSPTPSTVSPNQLIGSGLNAGTTNVTVTAAGGCSTTASFTMGAIPAAANFTAFSVNGNYTLTCLEPSITMSTTSSSLNYTWSGPPSQNGPQVTYTAAGNYFVQSASPTSTCTASQTFSIFQNYSAPTSTVNTHNITISCAPGTTTLIGSITSPTVNTSICWIYPGGVNPVCTNPILPGSVGVYTCVCTNLFTGCSTIQTVTVTASVGFPVFDITSSTGFTLGCAPQNTTNLCVVNVTTSPTPGSTINYGFVPPAVGGGASTVTPVYSAVGCVTTSIPGAWVVYLKDLGNSCVATQTVNVISNTISPTLGANVLSPNTPTLTCANPSILAIGTTSTNNTTISWIQPVSQLVPSYSIAINTATLTSNAGPALYANYTVVATNTVNGCKTTSVVPIFVDKQIPTYTIVPGTKAVVDCKGVPVDLTAAPTNTVFNASFYVWTYPVTSNTVVGSQISVSVAATYTTTGTFIRNGCTNTATFIVKPDYVKPIIIPFGNAVLDCSNNPQVQLPIIVSNTAGVSYTWTAVNPATAFTPTNTIAQPSVNLPGEIKVFVKNNGNGCDNSAVITVVTGTLLADFTSDPSTGFAPLNVNFTNLSTSVNTNSINSIWSFGNGTSANVSNVSSQSTIYTQPGTYTVTLIAKKGPCIDSAYKIIRVDIPSKLDVPNVFTPNGDGSNDVFFLKTTNLSDITAYIFDRWGNKVYDVTSNTGNIAWDGKNQEGKECAAGTYFYIIKATGKDGSTYDKKGNVSLYR